jgi:ubiquinone/menaquinone biosynthesis C-methylase UbiE
MLHSSRLTPGEVRVTDYHERHGRYAAAPWHRRFLRHAYHRSFELLDAVGWRGSARAGSKVLLCGTGAAATSVEFATSLTRALPEPSLIVVDLAPAALTTSRSALRKVPMRINAQFVCADAKALPFADSRVDLVETDFLLQFLNGDDRRSVLREWARILGPGGGLMTRDWVTRTRGLDRVWDPLRRAVIRMVLGARTYVLSTDELCRALHDAGFHAVIRPLGRWPLIHVVAAVVRDGAGHLRG